MSETKNKWAKFFDDYYSETPDLPSDIRLVFKRFLRLHPDCPCDYDSMRELLRSEFPEVWE